MRLVVNLRGPEADALDALTSDGRTRTEVVHRALNVLRYVEEVQRDGGRVLVEPKDGDAIEVRWS